MESEGDVLNAGDQDLLAGFFIMHFSSHNIARIVYELEHLHSLQLRGG